MAETKKNSTQSQSFSEIFKDKSILSVVIATLVLLLISFFAFRYFGSTGDLSDKLNGDGLSNILSTKTEEKSTDTEVKATPSATPTISENKNTDKNSVSISNDEVGFNWVAKDYQPNELKGKEKTHNVVKGDTLWEIAEAHYGNGADWHKIADANHVSYLSNGNPLIIPGQVITIP